MTEFERLGFNELCDRLEIPMKTLLLMHTSPDADTLGSCLALASLLGAAESMAQFVSFVFLFSSQNTRSPSEKEFFPKGFFCFTRFIPSAFLYARGEAQACPPPFRCDG